MLRGDDKNGLMAAIMELYFKKEFIPSLGWTSFKSKMKQEHDVLNVQCTSTDNVSYNYILRCYILFIAVVF